MSSHPKQVDQKGIAALALLVILTLGIFIIWEINENIQIYSGARGTSSSSSCPEGTPGCEASPSGEIGRVCKTGDTIDCNDSNDVFILN